MENVDISFIRFSGFQFWWLWGSFKLLIFRGTFCKPWFNRRQVNNTSSIQATLFLGCLWGALWRSTTREMVLFYASFKHSCFQFLVKGYIHNGTHTQYTISPLYIILHNTIRNILRYTTNTICIVVKSRQTSAVLLISFDLKLILAWFSPTKKWNVRNINRWSLLVQAKGGR